MEELLTDTIDQNELQKFEIKYNDEARTGEASNKTKFEYAHALVRSEFASDIKRAISLLSELHKNHPDGRRNYTYYLAIAHTKLKDFESAMKFVQAFLGIEPQNQQVLNLEKFVKKNLNTEMVKDVAVASGAVLAIGAILGIGYALLSKKKTSRPDDDDSE